ncbi:MAG: O-antigen ligase family protein [Candidatus Kaelpia aquatica]|nr:O-antigen ligase family protein [Candidatus Kaelpia aquatica]
MKKGIFYLEKALLVTFSLFIIFIPYFSKTGKICLVIGGLLWLIINLLKYNVKFFEHIFSKTVLNKPLLFFGLALIASLAFGLNPYHSYGVLMERYFYYFIFFLIGSYLVKDRQHLIVLTIFLILSGVILGVGGVWDYSRSPARLFSSFGIYTAFTPYLALGIPLLFMIGVFGKNKFLRLGSLMGVIVLFSCLLANFSRAAWAAILVSLLVVSFMKNKKITVCIVVIFVVGALFLSPAVKQRAIASFDISTWGGREEMYEGALEIFKDFPVFGSGLGQSERLLSFYKPELSRHLHAHNAFLEVLLETGMIGLLTFLWILVMFFKNMFKSIRLCQDKDVGAIQLGLSGGIFASLLLALTTTIIIVGFQDAALFWFLLGMGAGLVGKKDSYYEWNHDYNVKCYNKSQQEL